MKSRLVRIGNSRGLRLPKALIEEAGLNEKVELRVHNGAIIISPVRVSRSGWAEAARKLAKKGNASLLDATTPTHFDEKEWIG